MADLSVTAPPTGVNPDKTYSDNTWLKYIWYSLTNAGATPSGLAGGGTQYAQGATTSPATGNVVLFRYNAAAPTYTEGQLEPGQMDASGNQKVTLATLLAGEDLTAGVMKVEQRFSYTHIAAGQATTVIKASAGFLHSITFNGPATATNVTTIYDHASGVGTVIAIPLATGFAVPGTLVFDVAFNTGLTIITGTANGADMTVSWR